MFFLFFHKTNNTFRNLIIYYSLNESSCNRCLWLSEYIKHTSGLYYLSVLHNCYFITDHLNDLHLMCDQKDCNSHLPVDLLKQFQNGFCSLWIQCTCCLVTEQDVRCCCQCPCDSHSLFLSSRKLAYINIFLIFQFYKPKYFFYFLINLFLWCLFKNQWQCNVVIHCF